MPDSAYEAYVELVGEEYADADGFEDAFSGEYYSERHFVEELIDDIGAEPGSLAAQYFDYDAFARDLFMSDYSSIVATGGGVFVFRNL